MILEDKKIKYFLFFLCLFALSFFLFCQCAHADELDQYRNGYVNNFLIFSNNSFAGTPYNYVIFDVNESQNYRAYVDLHGDNNVVSSSVGNKYIFSIDVCTGLLTWEGSTSKDNVTGDFTYYDFLGTSNIGSCYIKGTSYTGTLYRTYVVLQAKSYSVNLESAQYYIAGSVSIWGGGYSVGGQYMSSSGFYVETYTAELEQQIKQNIKSDQIISGQQSIINNQNTNSQNEINNATQNKNDIINNQNQNTQDMIDSQKACKILSYNKNNINNFESGQLNSNGVVTSAVVLSVSPFLQVDNNTKFYNSGSWPNSLTNEYFCLYTENKVLISCYRFSDYYSSNYFNFENFNDAKYLRFTIWNQSNNNGTLYVKTCKDGNQALNDSINELNDSIKDDNIDSPNSVFDDLNNKLATNNVISSLITLPITFYTSVLNGLNGTCSSFNLGNLLGTDIILPCINISNYIGNSLWNIIDILFSGFFILHMSKKFISVFDNMSSLKDGDVIDD